MQPGAQTRLELDAGLESPHAEDILRAMDTDAKLGLRDAGADLLAKARVRTRGYPRALEALFAILSADRDSTLQEILNDTAGSLPDNVVDGPGGRGLPAASDSTAQQVMQALAIYTVPDPAGGQDADYLRQPDRAPAGRAAAGSRRPPGVPAR